MKKKAITNAGNYNSNAAAIYTYKAVTNITPDLK